MNGHPRYQAKVSVHCRWPLIRGTDGHVELCRDIDNVAVHSRWPLTTGVAQGRYYCTQCYSFVNSYICPTNATGMTIEFTFIADFGPRTLS